MQRKLVVSRALSGKMQAMQQHRFNLLYFPAAWALLLEMLDMRGICQLQGWTKNFLGQKRQTPFETKAQAHLTFDKQLCSVG